MFKFIKRWWAYLTASANSTFDANADPKIQMEQALAEAQEQHRELKTQAANVIANSKQAELRLTRSLEELEKVTKNAHQAVRMADEAAKKGDTVKAEEYTNAAQAFATKLIGIESEVENLKQLSLNAAQAADQAKAAVQTHGQKMQQKLAERQQLLSQLDQVNMQETVNSAMAQLSEAAGQETPGFEEIREKIERRYAQAKGVAELQESTVEAKMIEVERAAMSIEADSRLDAIRVQLGIGNEAEELPAGKSEGDALLEEAKKVEEA